MSSLLTSLAPFAAALATLIGIFIGTLFVAIQIRETKRLAKATFINELDKDIAAHNLTHTRMRLDPQWPNIQNAHLDEGVVTSIYSYLNFFERIKGLIDSQVIDLQTIDHLYAFRFFTLTSNRYVAENFLNSQEYRHYFPAIILLHEQWHTYRKKNGLHIPNEADQFQTYGSSALQ